VADVEDARLAGDGADRVERGGEVLAQVGVEVPAPGRPLPRRAVAAQVEREAVEPRAGEERGQGVALHAEVERLAVHGDAVDEQHRR
jgi:hypothetical protein